MSSPAELSLKKKEQNVSPERMKIQGEILKKLVKQYPFNNYNMKTKKFGIYYYETNKIRILLSRFYNTGGYPVKFNNHVSYYSGIAQWLPDQWAIDAKMTRDAWLEHPQVRWRQVMIWKIDLYDKDADRWLVDLGSLFPLGNALISGLEVVPIATSRKWVDIYPNLLFYNTINDKIIWANWASVLDDLNSFEKGFKSFEQVKAIEAFRSWGYPPFDLLPEYG